MFLRVILFLPLIYYTYMAFKLQLLKSPANYYLLMLAGSFTIAIASDWLCSLNMNTSVDVLCRSAEKLVNRIASNSAVGNAHPHIKQPDEVSVSYDEYRSFLNWKNNKSFNIEKSPSK